jgi:L-alanine-DL-glutamate epimerase-like enolase superfamily enzyme
MANPLDVHVVGAELYFLPVRTRVPLKFGADTLTSVTCARVKVTVADAAGRTATGWGETPLSVQWTWPSALGYEVRHGALKAFCLRLAAAITSHRFSGHAFEIGHEFSHAVLPGLVERFNKEARLADPLPHLAALACFSVFDLAAHDAYGVLHGVDTYQTYGPPWMNRDLAAYLTPADSAVNFRGLFPRDFLNLTPPQRLPAWHLVGGLDAIESADAPADAPRDGYPVTLREWIARDGLKCLKIKLRGTDAAWDFDRLVKIGNLALETGVNSLSADFNCTVTAPRYVNDILDRLRADYAAIWDLILYIEQPFPYDLEKYPIDVRSVASRKPLFLDESAHDWTFVRLGRSLGWTGVALKTCKTQTGALLSLCWARTHGMSLMVQDLTNPMLAQIPHCRLAAHAQTIMGVETNAMQFYPAASDCEERIHPGLYRRRDGQVDLSTLGGPGFGYRVDEINRPLPTPAIRA